MRTLAWHIPLAPILIHIIRLPAHTFFLLPLFPAHTPPNIRLLHLRLPPVPYISISLSLSFSLFVACVVACFPLVGAVVGVVDCCGRWVERSEERREKKEKREKRKKKRKEEQNHNTNSQTSAHTHTHTYTFSFPSVPLPSSRHSTSSSHPPPPFPFQVVNSEPTHTLKHGLLRMSGEKNRTGR